MKRTLALSALLVLVVLAGGCGNSSNPCRDYSALAMSAYDEGCTDKTDCCFCTCWKDGHKGYDPVTLPCTCTTVVSVDDLVGMCDQDEARQCLTDTASCRSGLVQSVDLICGGIE